MPTLVQGDQKLASDSEKAKSLADLFFKNHELTKDQNASSPVEDEVNEVIHNLITRNDDSVESISLIRPKEVSTAINRLATNKAPGADGVRNIILKRGGKKLTIALTYIFNACLMLSYFPASWKSSIIIPVPKPGKPRADKNSYRPISLLSASSKVFERLLLARLDDHLEKQCTLPDQQFGFRAGLSSLHQIDRVVAAIRKGFSLGHSTGMVLLDLKSAFDTVWHKGLVYKLDKSRLPAYLTKIVWSFLPDRTFRVRVGNYFSTSRTVPAGVPQGAVMSPTLFNVYVSDIPTAGRATTAQFADGISTWYTAKSAATVRMAL